MSNDQRRDPRPHGFDVRVTPVSKGHIRGRLVRRSSRKQARIDEQIMQRAVRGTFQALWQEARFKVMQALGAAR